MSPTLIETSNAMDELVLRLSKEKVVAVDTEFFRETTYYPKLALVQIATHSIVACIDPLAFDAKPALKKILCDKDITKIFHSCSQDLEVLFYYLNEIPTPIYDTQIANALLTDHHQIGYASLVENELNVQLDKSQTRTNWLQRPLTEKQIQYAGDDVLYLYQLHQILEKKLHDTGRQPWFDEESKKLICREDDFQVSVNTLWKRVKGASKLNREKLVIVQAIAEWREKIAQQKDKTRRRALPDILVIQLASEQTVNGDVLKQIISPQYDISSQNKEQLLATIKLAKNAPKDSWPDNRFTVLDGNQKLLLKAIQLQVNKKADELYISSAMLCSRKDLEQLILLFTNIHATDKQAAQINLNIIQGWRLHCIGENLIEIIKESIK
jgi:ribonuclease D